MDIDELISELALAADMAQEFGNVEDGNLYLIAIAHLRNLEGALADANGVCRAALSVAQRKGEKTNWDGLTKSLGDSLVRQHKVMFQAKENQS